MTDAWEEYKGFAMVADDPHWRVLENPPVLVQKGRAIGKEYTGIVNKLKSMDWICPKCFENNNTEELICTACWHEVPRTPMSE